MKIIFLDVDGVLNNYSTTERCGDYCGIETDCLSRLKKLVDISGAEIVLVSTWKDHWEKDERLKYKQDEFANYIDARFAEKGLKIYDKTCDEFDGEYSRGGGIANYIEKSKPEKFVINDDNTYDYDMCGLSQYLVKTDRNYGLLECKTMRAFVILGCDEACEPHKI